MPASNPAPEKIKIALENSGLNLSPPHLQELIEVHPHIEAMLARVRAAPATGAEPAHLFFAAGVGRSA